MTGDYWTSGWSASANDGSWCCVDPSKDEARSQAWARYMGQADAVPHLLAEMAKPPPGYSLATVATVMVRAELADLARSPVPREPAWSEQAVAWARALLDAHAFDPRLDLAPASRKFARTIEAMRVVGAALGVEWRPGPSTRAERLVAILVARAEARPGNGPVVGAVGQA